MFCFNGLFLFFFFWEGGWIFFPVAGQIKLTCFAEVKGIIYYYSLHSKMVSCAAYADLIGGIEENDFNSFGWLIMSNFRL